jgi:hypothetical protein
MVWPDFTLPPAVLQPVTPKIYLKNIFNLSAHAPPEIWAMMGPAPGQTTWSPAMLIHPQAPIIPIPYCVYHAIMSFMNLISATTTTYSNKIFIVSAIR